MLLMCCAKGKSICNGVEPSGAIEPPRVIDSTEPSRSVPQGLLGLGTSGIIGSGIGGTIFGLPHFFPSAPSMERGLWVEVKGLLPWRNLLTLQIFGTPLLPGLLCTT